MHIYLAKASDPIYDEKWLNDINHLKMSFEGTRSGYCIPFIEEVKFYQVRIKEECAPDFLRYVKAIDVLDDDKALMLTKMFNSNQDFLIHGGGGNVKRMGKFKSWILVRLVRFTRWLLSKFYIVQVKSSEEGKQNEVLGHSNVFNLGAFKDTKGKWNEELICLSFGIFVLYQYLPKSIGLVGVI